MIRIGGSGGTTLAFSSGGLATRAATAGLDLMISSSRTSALILSIELEGTLAAAMPNSLAFTRTSLLSRPSFFAIS